MSLPHPRGVNCIQVPKSGRRRWPLSAHRAHASQLPARVCLHGIDLCSLNRYSAINEINKTLGTKDFVFVYFITKLSRMGSGTAYVGFHGGRTTTLKSVVFYVVFEVFLI